MAPGGALKITGVGEIEEVGLVGTAGTDATGDDVCFVGVGCAALGATVGTMLAGAPSGVTKTGAIGFNDAELADAAEAD